MMKNLKDIFEGIFDKGNKDNVGKNINGVTLFGHKYRLKFQYLNKENIKWLNGRALNKITKGMEYINGDDRNYFNHNDMSMKVGKLCNWIEHISLGEWGFSEFKGSNDFKDFSKRLQQELYTLGVFDNTKDITIEPHLWMIETNRFGCNLCIHISKNGWNTNNDIEIYYEKI